MFPSVDHVERFDMRPDKARTVMDGAEAEMCTMGMTYAIALHEDFIKTCLSWLIPLGLFTKSKLNDTKTHNAHENFASAAGCGMDADSLALFHLTRLTRNCHIHAGGAVDPRLSSAYSALTTNQSQLWERLTGEPFAVPSPGSAATVGVGGLIATLAIGKRLAYDVNLGLQTAIPRDTWADMAAAEYFDQGSKSPRDPAALRSLKGYLRSGYTALGLTDAELTSAIQRYKK